MVRIHCVFFFFTLYPERHSSHMSSLKWSRNIYYMAFLLEESYSFQLVNTDPIRGIETPRDILAVMTREDMGTG